MTSTTALVESGTWTLCAGTLAFRIRNWGFVQVPGTIPIVTAAVRVAPGGRIVAVDAAADLAAINTGNAKRDRDLAKPRFLDSGRHPILTFRAAQTDFIDGDIRCVGQVTARENTAKVEMHANISPSPAGEIRLSATARVDRLQLGIQAPRFLIGRWVEVRIMATFARAGD